MTFDADSVHVDRLHPSPNIEPRREGFRPTMLLLHYTGLPTVERSIEVLSRVDCKVSCHYVVGEDGLIVQMVAENMRAWHAGVAEWAGETDVNSMSIGIEIQNQGHEAGCPEFPEAQMQAVERLAQDIVGRHSIAPWLVLGHSDVAPSRKRDPGEKFEWRRLARAGVGLWVEPADVVAVGEGLRRGDSGEAVAKLHELLGSFGYGVCAADSFGEETEAHVIAFQRHFRPALCDGVYDWSTQDTLQRLVLLRDRMRATTGTA